LKLRSRQSALILFALIVCAASGLSQTTGNHLPPSAHLTSEQDHQRMMDLLHIASLRRGADGDPKSPNAAIYDESRVSPYPQLPEPLGLKDGRQVITPGTWWDKRRSEIVEDFDREIYYGREPKNTPKVNWEVLSTKREMNGEIAVTTRKLAVHVDNSAYPLLTVDIDLTLTMPSNANGPVPVMIEFSWSPEVCTSFWAERIWDHRVSADRDRSDRRRHSVPPT
jgi:hypothetical protein